MAAATYASDARRWVIQQYIIFRREGHTPLQAMLMVWQEADAMRPIVPAEESIKEWRKAYARRQFMTIALRVRYNHYWRKSCLTSAASN